MRREFSPHVSDSIRALSPYVPGKPIEETKRELGLKKVVKLASNENPLGPSPLAAAAIKAMIRNLHRYPDATAFSLKSELARFWDLENQNFLIGNGSNEIIDLLIRTYCIPGDFMATPYGSFIAYQICAQIQGVNTIHTDVDDEFVPELDSVMDQIGSEPKTKIIFLANPNNPTGTHVSKKNLITFLQKTQGKVIVALDYAYWEYVTTSEIPNPRELITKFDHVIVMNTFSKVYGLAGLRVGYAMAQPRLLSWLERVRQPFNFSSIALEGAIAALKDKNHLLKSQISNKSGMKFWETALKKINVPFLKSQGNFILVDVYKACQVYGGDMFQACLKAGVIFRPVTNYDLPGYLRISIGTQSENLFAFKVFSHEINRFRKAK